MSVVVKYEDFVSAYSFSVQQSLEQKVRQEITRYEKEWLMKMFGLDMAKDFILNYNTNPEYQKLFDEMEIVNHSCFSYHNHILYSRGLKTCMMGLVYFSLNKTSGFTGTSSGTKLVTSDLTELGRLNEFLNMRYNESVNDVRCIQAYIHRNYDKYPLFKHIANHFLLNTNL